MAKARPHRRTSDVLRVTGAPLATLPVAVAAAVCLARWLPGDVEVRFMLGMTLVIPLWVTAMCHAFLANAGMRVWLGCALGTLVLGGLAYGVPP